MKLRRLKIEQYGPLSDIDLKLDHGLQCVFGPNESGKTLLVDAFLKMSLGGKQPKRLRDALQRVPETPRGYLRISDGSDEVTIDGILLLTEKAGMSSEDLRDIFVIRNSDLSFLDEEKCLGGLTDRILNLSTNRILLIQEKIREIGRITEKTESLSGAGGESSPSSQESVAQKLISDIDDYLESLDEEQMTSAEQKVIDLEIDKEKTENLIEDIELSLKQKKMKDLEDAITCLSSTLEEMEKLDPEAVKNIEKALTDYDENSSNLSQIEEEKRLFFYLSLIGAAGIATSAVLFLLIPVGFLGILQTTSIVVFTVYASTMFLRRMRRLASANSAADALRALAQDCDLEDTDIGETYESLQAVVKEAGETSSTRDKLIGRLQTLLDSREQTPSTLIEEAKQRVEGLQQQVGNAERKEYDEDALEEAKIRLKESKESLQELRESLRKHTDALREFETESAKIRFEDYLGRPQQAFPDCVESLRQLRDELNEFSRQIQQDAQAARIANSIYDQLLEEEQSKVSELLSTGSRASEVFSEITSGSYAEIKYVPEQRHIVVVDRDGKEFVPEDLSKATRDQLYMAIRLALGEELFGDEKGFFIMDDPFLASDLERADTQYSILEKMVGDGWQIVLFTARKDLAESISQRFGTTYIELEPIRD